MKKIILTIVMAATLMTSCTKTKSQECMLMDDGEWIQAADAGYCPYAIDEQGNPIYDYYGNYTRPQ